MTVFANGKPAVFQQSQGKVTTTDVCLTPPFAIPVPFSNLAQAMDLDKCAQSVFINGYPVAHEKSIFKKSSGDEGGAMLGVTSATVGSTAQFLKGSPDVMVEGFGVVRHGDLVVSNNNNTPSAPFMQPGMEMPAQLKAQYEAQKKIKPTPYVYDVDVVGTRVNSLEQLCAFTKDVASTTLIGGTGDAENTNKVTRRILLRNVAASQNALALRVPVQTGSGMIDLPLSTPIVTPRNSEQDKTAPVAGQAKTIMVACSLAWNTFPHSQTLNVSAGDFTDIARFSDDTRTKIYTDLATATPDDLKNKPWNKIITTATSAVNIELTSPSAALNAGWLYIFKDGFLWRELQVNAADTVGQNTYEEVNLLQYAGSNQRVASGQATPQLVLPYKIDGTAPKLEIAYSPVQWSWARINYFGGMDPQDPRLTARKNKTKVAMPSNSSSRSARFATLDLSPFTTPDAQRKQIISGASDAPTIILINKNMTPTIMVNDPVGLVGRLTTDLVILNVQLQSMVSEASHHELFRSALLTYQTFFDPRNAKRVKTTVAIPEANMPGANGMVPASQTVDADNENLADAQYIDRDKIETILNVKKRASLRALIQQIQTANTSLFDVKNKSKWYQTPLHFNDQFIEYFATGDHNYLAAYQCLSGMLSTTSYDPHCIDSGLDVYDPKEPMYTPPGYAYASALMDTAHPLHSSLFPSDAQVSDVRKSGEANEEYVQAALVQKCNEQDSGNGTFNVFAMMLTFNFAEAQLSLLENIIGSIIHVLGRSIKAGDQNIKASYTLIKNWMNVTGDKHLASIDIAATGAIPDDYEIIGFEEQSVQNYHDAQQQHNAQDIVRKTELTSEDKSILNKVYMTGQPVPDDLAQKLRNEPINLIYKPAETNTTATEKILKSFYRNDVLNNQGAALKPDAQLTESIYDGIRSGKLGKLINTQVFIRPKSDSVWLARLQPLNKGLSSIALAFQLHDLFTVREAMAKQKDMASKRFTGMETVFYTGFALEQTYIAFKGMKNVESLYRNANSVKNFRGGMLNAMKSALTPLAFAGGVASIIDLVFSVGAFLRAEAQHNTSGEISAALRGMGDVLNILSILVDYAPEGTYWFELGDLLGPIGLYAAAAFYFAVILDEAFAQTALEKYARANPFSKSNPTQDKDEMVTGNLLTALSQPMVSMTPQTVTGVSPNYQSMAIVIQLPYFMLNDNTLVVETTWEYQHNSVGSNALVSSQQNYMTPSSIQQVTTESGGIIEMRYRYTNVPVSDSPGMSYGSDQILYRTRVRLLSKDKKIGIPYTSEPIDMSASQNLTIDLDQKGWVYATLLM